MEDASEDYRPQRIFDHGPVILTLIYSRYSDAATLLVMLAGRAIILNRKEMEELSAWLVEQLGNRWDRLS